MSQTGGCSCGCGGHGKRSEQGERAIAGCVGEPQTVKIYFGEYSLRMISETRQWFSNIADCELKLLVDGTLPTGETHVCTRLRLSGYFS